ncbi:Aryl-alcohol dehydrogenase [Fusarium albosuccineum]|uniref:Aryl-alcohol dehydrogenase n=1 Tax=Fusarium albosuccineum TaxID=1237068 RepID=A0A8H4P5E4_9HYPO|nr:Aryl-alcohol dehydrogenase [Fusarium albosuccineum]
MRDSFIQTRILIWSSLKDASIERRRSAKRRAAKTSQRDSELSSGCPLITDATEPRLNQRRETGCALLRPGAQLKLRLFISKAYQDYILASPQPSYLSTLVQVNVLNALTHNGFALGFENRWQRMGFDSPFATIGPLQPCTLSCPQDLQPTPIQRRVSHHAWIDLFPIPKMRDAILQSLEHIDLQDLCGDILDVKPGLEGKSNLLVWGDPSDPRGWEASTNFLRKWGWLLRGCQEVFEATNYWRQVRGEATINFEFEF